MITEEMFSQFKSFSEKGTPNMLDPKVQKRSGLSEEVFAEILANRSAYEEKFGGTKLEPEPITESETAPVEEPEEPEVEETEEEEPEPEPEEPEEEVEEDCWNRGWSKPERCLLV